VSRIVLDGITKRYPDGTTAVRSLDLDVGDGELLVLVGPSGCGKTTALRMVAGLEEVTGGTIYIDGRPVNDVEPRDRDIAMVFQSYALYPHLTVYDNMAFSLKYRKIPKDEIRRRVGDAARILELEPYLQRKPRQLSGGQRQRVAMGRAIVRQPRAFLMDEPLSNLDAKLRVQMRAEIARLQRSLGVTTIYVTHDQTEALSMSDRVAVMSKGRFIEVATPQELYSRPRTAFSARFVGGANILEGRATRDGGRTAIDTGLGRLMSAEPAQDGPITLFIRLEKIVWLDERNGQSAARDGMNRFACRIVGRRYAGDTSEFDLSPLDGDPQTVLRCRFPADIGGAPGDTISIGIEPEHVHLLAQE
jgi:ABC-type sugar transport system ATPase subunit